MARFTLPRDIYHGKDALEALKSFTGKRAMVCVGGGSMKRFGFLDKVVSYLREAGMEVELIEGIEPDPSVDTVMKGAKATRALSSFAPREAPDSTRTGLSRTRDAAGRLKTRLLLPVRNQRRPVPSVPFA